MEIKSVEFVKSSQHIGQCPEGDTAEYAFIGRSNVGKSSLINMLTSRKKLAKVSSTPGKTQLINHFLINEKWHLVDLPGYGFAKISKTIKEKWERQINEYILEREQLVGLFVLIDIRHKLQQNDLMFMTWLIDNDVPFGIVFTKADKIGKNQVMSNVASYKKSCKKHWTEFPDYFITSADDSRGKEEILEYLSKMNEGE